MDVDGVSSDDDEWFPRLSLDWCRQNVDQSIQKYIGVKTPPGIGVIYAYILREGSKRAYVGQAEQFKDRHAKHINALKWQMRPILIDYKIHEYGIDAFDIVILEVLPFDQLDAAEIHYIAKFDLLVQYGRGYNVLSGGGRLTDYDKKMLSACVKAHYAKETPAEKEARCKKLKDVHQQPEVIAKHSEASSDRSAETLEKMSTARKRFWERMSESERDLRAKNIQIEQSRPDVVAAKSVRAEAQRKRERREQLLHARTVAIPFEKSKKRRAELRAASTDYSGKGKTQALYMVSEDGLTIRFVTKDGIAGSRNIVGPLVDP